jgi:hypothetical protein
MNEFFAAVLTAVIAGILEKLALSIFRAVWGWPERA